MKTRVLLLTAVLMAFVMGFAPSATAVGIATTDPVGDQTRLAYWGTYSGFWRTSGDVRAIRVWKQDGRMVVRLRPADVVGLASNRWMDYTAVGKVGTKTVRFRATSAAGNWQPSVDVGSVNNPCLSAQRFSAHYADNYLQYSIPLRCLPAGRWSGVRMTAYSGVFTSGGIRPVARDASNTTLSIFVR